MDALDNFLAKLAPGTQVWVSPADLRIQPDTFDAKARVWERNGGGETFTYLDDHRESQTGARLIDMVRVRYDGPTSKA